MADLLNSLSSAARALDAQTLGLNVTGQNIANLNTPGYARRTVQFAEIPPTGQDSAGDGVSVVAIQAERTDLLEAQLRYEQPAQSRASSIADSLSQVEVALGTPGQSIDADLTQFYTSFSVLAQDPTSGSARQQVIVQGQTLASAFNNVAAKLSTAQRDADAQVKSTVDQINALAGQVATLNSSLDSANQSSNEAVKDQLTTVLGQLSQLIDIGVVPSANGGADVSVGNGRALVIGTNTYALSATPAPVTGLANLNLGGQNITNEVTGGTAGGLLQVRDVLVPDYQTRLDQLAFGVATSVNAVHQGGYDLNGNPGGNFFSPLASASGAASSLAVAPAVAADGNLIAAAGSPAAGDNQNARALTNLLQTPLAGLTTNPTDTWGSLVYRVGIDSQVAQGDKTSRDDVIKQLQTLRDQVSAVSLDEEAANLMKFQRAYEANARYFSAVDASLTTLMQMVGTT